jgi:hypothetical protein
LAAAAETFTCLEQSVGSEIANSEDRRRKVEFLAE